MTEKDVPNDRRPVIDDAFSNTLHGSLETALDKRLYIVKDIVAISVVASLE